MLYIYEGNAPRKRMNPAAPGLFAARDSPDGRPPFTDWRDDARPAGAFPHMLEHASNAATVLATVPVRLRATVNDSLHARFSGAPPPGNTSEYSLPDLRPLRIHPPPGCSLTAYLL